MNMSGNEENLPIKRLTVGAMVEAYNRAYSDIKFAQIHLKEAAEGMAAAFGDSFRFGIEITAGYGNHRFDDALTTLKGDTWRSIVTHCDIIHTLSVADAEKLDKELHDVKGLPPVTVENVFAFVAKLIQDGPAMLERAVVEVFKGLTPQKRWADNYKTNDKCREVVGKKVILGILSPGYSNGMNVNHYRDAFVNALGNVFLMLDKKPVSKTWQDGLVYRFNNRPKGEDFRDEYFDIKAFSNGNAHITFLRPDLVDRLNAIAAGSTLGSHKEEVAA